MKDNLKEAQVLDKSTETPKNEDTASFFLPPNFYHTYMTLNK